MPCWRSVAAICDSAQIMARHSFLSGLIIGLTIVALLLLIA
jgi:hypothetical protein